jgi:type IV secretory pathway VirB10-like protein
MKQRFLMWGLASIAFAVTLAISSWHEGLWPADETPTGSNRPVAIASADPMPLPAQPFGPAHPAPAVATPIVTAVTPPQPQAPQQSETVEPASEVATPIPTAEAEVDTAEFLRHRDRAAQHSARAR